MTRRGFVARSLGLALTVYGAGRLGLFDEGIASAAAGRGGPILVSIFMPGGADGMSMLYPARRPSLRQARPSLALSGGQAFTEDTRLAWHPALAPLAQLHAEGKVTALPAIGYDHPDQSHFTSRHYWEVGATDAELRTGWMGRYLDEVGTADNPLQGLSLTGQLEPTLATSRVPVAAIAGPTSTPSAPPGVWGTVGRSHARDARTLRGAARPRDPALRTVARSPGSPTASAASCSRSPTRRSSSRRSPTRRRATASPQHLAGLAAMIGAGLPLHCVALEASGEYDTHADEAASLSTAFGLTAQSLLAFQRDLEARGVADRVLTLLWSEFGRRAQENGFGRHRPRGRRHRVPDRLAGRGRHGRRVPGLATRLDADGNVKPTVRLPRRLCLAPRAVARLRRGADRPRRGQVRASEARCV